MGEFSNKVFEVVRSIPCGKVSTYGQIASMIGSPRSARYVGYALRSNPDPAAKAHASMEGIPCHRVVFKDGRLAPNFAFGGEGVQRRLLESEGVSFDDEGRVRMDEHLWDGSSDDIGPSIREQRAHGADDRRDDPSLLGPPSDFDWEAELGE